MTTTLACQSPVLIIAPSITLKHWEKVFSEWTHLNAIVYHGSIDDRKVICAEEFAFDCDRPRKVRSDVYLRQCHQNLPPKVEKLWMVQCVITTPEVFLNDFTELSSLRYEVIVVDEAHRLKNHSSKFRNHLLDPRLKYKQSLLLTGTPIQNNVDELWSLLNIIDCDKFKDRDMFIEKFGNMKEQKLIEELHETVKPHMLRRLKEDVESSIPILDETLIEVELTILQKKCYRALYEKNISFFNNYEKTFIGRSRQKMNNISMQLRKCCNHPFLLSGVEDKSRAEDDIGNLVEASGKLILLDKLLPKLKEDGHKVLIFSNFTTMLDIIEDYLKLRRYTFGRIDGSKNGRERQLAIDRFQNDENDSLFIMLLSTRAAGLGKAITQHLF